MLVNQLTRDAFCFANPLSSPNDRDSRDRVGRSVGQLRTQSATGCNGRWRSRFLASW